MQAAVIETPGEPPRVRERRAPDAGPDARCTSGSRPRRSRRSTCSAPPARRTSACRPRPYVPGVQGVGVVERGAVPAGTPVWFATSAGMPPGDGSMRAVATAPERDVVALPAAPTRSWSPALGLSAVAAWMALTWRGGLAAGEQVLVLGRRRRRRAGRRPARPDGRRPPGGGRRALGAGPASGRCGSAPTPSSRSTTPTTSRPGRADAGRVRRAARPRPRPAVRRARGRGAARAAAARPAGQPRQLRRARPRRSSRRRCAASSLRVLGYTNNELTREQRREALTTSSEEAAAGRLHVDARAGARSPTSTRGLAVGRAGGRVVSFP